MPAPLSAVVRCVASVVVFAGQVALNFSGNIQPVSRSIATAVPVPAVVNLTVVTVASTVALSTPPYHKGNTAKAIEKLQAALAWRKEFGVNRIIDCFGENGDEEMQTILREENATGKIYVRGFDREGRAGMYMRPHHENTKDEVNQMRHLVFNLEKAVACTRSKSGYEKINLMIDYAGYRLRDMPPMSTARYTLDILQKHYPERMFKAYVINPPFVFRTFWTIIKPFLDPVTKEKIVFCHGKAGAELMAKRYDMTQVEECVGGTGKSTFDSTEYLGMPWSEPLGV